MSAIRKRPNLWAAVAAVLFFFGIMVPVAIVAGQQSKPLDEIAAAVAAGRIPHEGIVRANGVYDNKGDKLALGASISVVSTITKSVGQVFLPFTGNSFTITGAQAPYVETTISTGTANAYQTSNGIGNVGLSNIQLFYALSDLTDGTVSVYGNTAGTGSAIAQLPLTAGSPYEWDSATAGTLQLGISASWQSLNFTAGTTAGGLSTTNTNTNFHMRSSLLH